MRSVLRRIRARTSLGGLVAGLAAVAFAASVASEARADDITVYTTDDLRNAIITVNNDPNPAVPHTITFGQDITLNTVLTPIASDVRIIGDGHTISGNDAFQVFFVDSGTVDIVNLTIRNGLSRGGNGGLSRGGGGLGAGGALFVNENATVTLAAVQFVNNTARGGDGGADSGSNAGGGGGGFHGDGGDFGGGGGYNGNGGNDGGGGGGLEGNGLDGVAGGNGGGEFTDGGGGRGNSIPNGTGEDGGEYQGGGFGETGGNGGRFGGGGGSNKRAGGNGGDFGGGGGSANVDGNGQPLTTLGGPGGSGGFGGGGGGSSDGTVSMGGFGGGNGTASGIGGAGSSLGGAIFVRTGGNLSWRLNAPQTTTGNSVTPALGSGQPEVAGSDLYLMSGIDVDLNVAAGDTGGLTGSIAGAGGLRKIGGGTLVLSGASSYTGGTAVREGTLQGTTSSLQGDISTLGNTTVRFQQDSSGSYSGKLSGGGVLAKAGSGTLTLKGANTYTGDTMVEAGVLSVTTATLPNGSKADVSTDATLRFDQSASGSRSGEISGAGHLEKNGTGTLSLTGSFTGWTGDTTVNGGELSVASILPGKVMVQPMGRLSGTGTASGDVIVKGTLVPGTDGTQGTLFIGGNLDLQSGSALAVDIDDQNSSDLVAVTGAATLDAGATVDVNPAAGDYTVPHQYDLLTAASVSGLPTIASDFCFFASNLSIVGGNILHLTLTPDIQLAGRCANTDNQRAVGTALSSGTPPVIDDPALADVKNSLNVLTETEVPHALDLLSGEGLSGFRTARLAAATRFLGSLSDRMRDPGEGRADTGPPYPLAGNGFGGPLLPSLGGRASLSDPMTAANVGGGVLAAATRRSASPFTFVSVRGESGLGGWLDGFATFAGIQGNGNTHDTDFNLYGTAGGVDWAFAESGMIGAAVGYTRSKLSVSDLATWGTGDTLQGAVYGTWSTDLFYLGAVARYGYTTTSTTRRVSFGSLYDTAKGSPDGSSISGYVETGLAAQELATAFFQPMASFQYTYLDTKAFTEKGAPGVNLNVDSESLNSKVTNLGVRVYRPFQMDRETDIVPELRVRWAHEFGDVGRPVDARFADVTTGPATFVVQGARVGRDVAVVGAGWTVIGRSNNARLTLSYDATLNSDVVAHAVSLGVLIYW